MATDKLVRSPIFQGVKYYICPSLPITEQVQLRAILDSNGATATALNFATRVITQQSHFLEFRGVECTAILLTPQWVHNSLRAGRKQLAKHYSADPAMFFSSLVVSAIGVSPSHANLIETITAKYGGQWAPILTDEVTHFIVDSSADITPTNHRPCVVSHAWFEDSFKRESAQNTAQYEQRRRDANSTSTHLQRPVAEHRTQSASVAPRRPLPFLPFELVTQVHIMCRDLALKELWGYITTLLGLTQVCRRWRAIAESNGPLWTHIYLDFHTNNCYKRRLKLAEERWIPRSGTLPLSVNIRSYFPHSPNPAIKFLEAHAPRIQDLSLQLAAAQFHSFFKFASQSFSALKTVDMSVISKSDLEFNPALGLTRSEYFAVADFSGDPDGGILWADVAFPITVFHQSPTVQKIKIDVPCGIIDPHILRLSWSNLTDIDLYHASIGVRDTLAIFPLLVNTIHLRFSSDSIQGPIMPPLAPVKLPVQTLKWVGLNVHDPSIFTPLSLPQLRVLELRQGTEPTLFILLRHSSFQLDALQLMFFQMSFAAVSKFLHAMPSLTSLDLSLSVALSDALMELLTYDNRNPRLPRLEKLKLFDRQKYFSEPAMLRMPLCSVDRG
ncbi:hypothetical protein DFH06DRAFT_1371655 [Mycena polygramma]|nr:hypothetical protein DFH06DRAFT_1371655 [Mycena polygramma]